MNVTSRFGSRRPARRSGILLARLAPVIFAASMLMPGLAFGVTLGQTDTFQDGTTESWTNGGGQDNNVITIASGGPVGVSDSFLEVSSGSFGGATRLTTFNDAQWTGDFVAAGVNAVQMDLKNFGPASLPIRVAVRIESSALGSSSTPGYASTTPFSLPADGAWHHAIFFLNESNMTPVGGPPPLAVLLTNVMDFRLLSSANPATIGDFTNALIGVDNISATAPVQIISPQVSGGNFSFSFASVSNESYTVYGTTNLFAANWVVRANILGNGSIQQVLLPKIDGMQTYFFRISTGMAIIPAGGFTMGDTLDGESDAIPTNVTVSAFYMDANLVSLSQWQTVYNWATNNGYGFDNAGAGKAANNPVQTVDWHDAVKWSNARSQQAGQTPAYYTDANLTHVYTNGEVDAVYVNWTAGGYRLPTEAEWEKAARGGLIGQRFPRGNAISESQANYNGNTNAYSYDLGPNGYNAIGSIGGTSPATSPVGAFAGNGYGLHDMAGNVYEWCWDWYGTPYAGETDPRGPGTGSERVLRGGCWLDDANSARCAARYSDYPSVKTSGFGFRCVRGL